MTETNKEPHEYEGREPVKSDGDPNVPPGPKAEVVEQHKFAPCPCGEVPTDLVITASKGAKYGTVQGNCCAAWLMEFKIGFPKDQADLQLKAMVAWNEAPRG